LMDSNNFPGNVGAGEREGRLACPLVARRHFGLAHGVGRAGDVAAQQPKAAGSSVLAALAGHLAADALRIAGLTGVGPVSVLPLATGMTLSLVLLALRQERPMGQDTVLLARCDQKTCLKAVTAAGLRPHVLPLRKQGDELKLDVQDLSDAVASLGSERILAIVSTTSCFAPRAPDDVVAVARLCAAVDIPHVVNNAYGVQCAATCKAIAAAWGRNGSGGGGRIDAVVQSTDKNFMVPVGGAIVAAPASRPELVAAVNGTYPGRAAVGAHLDLLMTLLHWGAEGWRKVLAQREALVPYMRSRLQELAVRQGERLLYTPANPISMALTLDTLQAAAAAAKAKTEAAAEAAAEVKSPALAEAEGPASISESAGAEADVATDASGKAERGEDGAAGTAAAGAKHDGEAAEAWGAAPMQNAATKPAQSQPPRPARAAAAPADVTFFGSMLFSRFVSGTRVVAPGKTQTVGGVSFHNYGSHTDTPYPSTYVTAAAALGMTQADVDELVARLERCFK
ncbi:hypothetical protein Agub_g9769, partial [Astrephomene gubernaculifera]